MRTKVYSLQIIEKPMVNQKSGDRPVIRRATSDDLPTIKQLYNQLTSDTANVEKDFPIILNDSNSICLILEKEKENTGKNESENRKEKGVAIGMAICYGRTSLSSGRKMLIDEIIIDTPYQGRGYGRALIQHCITMAKNMGLECIELACALTRTDLHTFYEGLGFEHTMRWYHLFLGDEQNESGDEQNESGDEQNESGDEQNESGDEQNESGDEQNESE